MSTCALAIINKEPLCTPCARTCQRYLYPYVGPLGWTTYVIDGILVVVTALMALEFINTDYRIILGLLIPAILVNLIFWIVNLYYYPPCYTTARAPIYDSACGVDLIVKECPGDYAVRVAADLRQANDEWHFRNNILGGVAMLFWFTLFAGIRGTGAFVLLPEVFLSTDIRYYVITKVIEIGIIVVFVANFIILNETRSDVMFRHFTSVGEWQTKDSKRDSPSVSYGASSTLLTNTNAGGLSSVNSKLNNRNNNNNRGDINMI